MLLLTADAGYIDEAAAALADDNVYVSAEVPDAAALHDQLSAAVGDESIGVAVFSDNAALEASGPEIVSELAAAHPECETIIVAVGDDLSAGSRVLAAGEAARLANEAESSGADVDGALTETIQGVIAQAPEPEAGVDAGPFIGIALAVAAVAAAGAVLFGVARSRRSRSRSTGHRPIPDRIRPLVARLTALSGEYAAAGAAGNAVAAEVAADAATIAQNTTELFERLDRKGDEGQREIVAVEYGETLRKVTAALDSDYLLDILRHPDLWDDPGERIREVRTAVSAFSAELVENIKQVNARRGLHFQVSLDGLIGRRTELQAWDREFGKASEGDGDARPTG
ncbi:hypothetical protein [Microbacterium terricola]|uniref:Uncharacterized protein n=1 Tax=Microbacterium terricola TaxID=344163 RepID=A0ABM8E2Y0_9MICO|nr:hypothetical protein [Microbacterium terricola]UYK40159.1 hypothetical protein OAU46_00480 [Microbacterium terricola]BDV32136.1 hypothetical protein Microterr_27960 [Microbacterium terricola]